MKLSVCCPVLNEAWFLDLWFQSVLSYADDVVIMDGGSTDGTLDIIQNYAKDDRVQVIIMLQEGRPYSEDWDEGRRRNILIDRARGDFILMLDADEMLGDNFNKNALEERFYGFHFVPFWKNIDTVRVSINIDPRWEGQILYRLFPRNGGYYTPDKHHCVLKFNEAIEKEMLPVNLFHWHYAFESFGHYLKPRDNRRGDLGFPFTDIPMGDIDYEFGNKHPELFGKDWKIITEEFKGHHPKIIRDYFNLVKTENEDSSLLP